jgi:hypothetical protein
MQAKLLVALLTMFVGLPAVAQFDAAEFAVNLLARYGHGIPLPTETLALGSGVEIVVNFAANGHVCSIQLPPTKPAFTAQSGEDVLTELVPLDMRGRERGRLFGATGAPSVSSIRYENVTISESWQGERQTGTIVIFPKEECPNRLSQ